MAQFHVDNYQLVTKNRYVSAHGGLAFYIHKSWNFKIRQDTTDSPLWEEMFVDIIDPRSPSNVKFSMGNFYRPPHTTVAQLKLFIRYFSQKLTELNSNNTAFVCGDYSVYEKLQVTRAKVAPVNLIYGSHFSATEATYKVSQNMGNFVKFTRITHKPVPV